MRSLIKLILLFETGIILSILLFNTQKTPKILSISSHLPDIVFENNDDSLTVIFTGDVMLGRSVNTRIQKNADPSWPFLNIAKTLSDSDMTIINLEAPFTSDCPQTDTGMIFCADPKSVFGLVFAGVDYAGLANNHINNYGQKGIDETISTLLSNNITPTGLGKTVFNTLKNTNFAILSFSDFPAMNEIEMKNQIQEATKSTELIITTFHWGTEYQKSPNTRQVSLAHSAIDSGADIVIGHHPHYIQSEETYLGKPIYYSLGNLVFDQMWSEETRLGEILKITFQGKTITKKEVFPVKIFDFGQPALQ